MKNGDIGKVYHFALKGPLLVPGHDRGEKGFLRSLRCGIRKVPECKDVIREESFDLNSLYASNMRSLRIAPVSTIKYTKGDIILDYEANWEDLYEDLYEMPFGYVGVSIYDIFLEDYPWFLPLFRKVLDASPIIHKWLEWEGTWVYEE